MQKAVLKIFTKNCLANQILKYTKVIVIKTAWNWQERIQITQCNRERSRNKLSHMRWQYLIKVISQITERVEEPIFCVEATDSPSKKKGKIRSQPHTIHKMTSRWIQDLNFFFLSYKPIRRKEKNCCSLGMTSEKPS